MNEKIIQLFNNLQIADLDDDMIGICKAFVDFMAEIKNIVGEDNLPVTEKPNNFYKLQPHLPRMELRTNYRKFLGYAVKRQEEDDEQVKLINIHVALQAGMCVYHMPVEKMIELSNQGELTRELALETLLNDDMSPNWIKEPSGRDFSAIML